jgi:hypothetical protein
LDGQNDTREREWYVPRLGPRRFRLIVGLSFYPYSLMNASYVVLGSMIAPVVHIDRAAGMAVAYLLAVGISAHSLDAMAPNRPWGPFLTKNKLLLLAVSGLVPSLGLGLYYALTYAPLLLPIGVAEVFFLLTYNLELFHGRFHKDGWFALSWGLLPVLAGYVVQADSLSVGSITAGLFGFSTAYLEISASRPYKALKKLPGGADAPLARKFEQVLKAVVLTCLLAAAFLYSYRFLG